MQSVSFSSDGFSQRLPLSSLLMSIGALRDAAAAAAAG